MIISQFLAKTEKNLKIECDKLKFLSKNKNRRYPTLKDSPL